MIRLSLLVLLLTATLGMAGEPLLAGRWTGSWQSSYNGHQGPLRGRFTQTDPTHYRAVFTGRFLKVVPFLYVQKLEVTGYSGDSVFLAGSSRLPGFGTFQYDAVATGNQFTATFRSSRGDQGVFLLSR